MSVCERDTAERIVLNLNVLDFPLTENLYPLNLDLSTFRNAFFVRWLCLFFYHVRIVALLENFKMALDCFFAVWFVVGNVWIFGGHSSSSDAPNLYRYAYSAIL